MNFWPEFSRKASQRHGIWAGHVRMDRTSKEREIPSPGNGLIRCGIESTHKILEISKDLCSHSIGCRSGGKLLGGKAEKKWRSFMYILANKINKTLKPFVREISKDTQKKRIGEWTPIIPSALVICSTLLNICFTHTHTYTSCMSLQLALMTLSSRWLSVFEPELLGLTIINWRQKCRKNRFGGEKVDESSCGHADFEMPVEHQLEIPS